MNNRKECPTCETQMAVMEEGKMVTCPECHGWGTVEQSEAELESAGQLNALAE